MGLDHRCLRAIGIAVRSLLVLAISVPAHALSFNVTYDDSVAAAPAGFQPAFAQAIHAFTSTYSDPITIHIEVGWNEIDGGPLDPGNLGQSLATQSGLKTYAQVKALLVGDARSAADALAVATLGAADPTGGQLFKMSKAEAKALGLIAGDAPTTDGFVGFAGAAPYTFDPTGGIAPGTYDFLALAEHEISEVMGRYGLVPLAGGIQPIELFRYTAAGAPSFVPASGAYLSIDGGTTRINTFNGAARGDAIDWAGLTPDAFNAFLSGGVRLPFSAGDVTEMDVIGYDLVPEPATGALLGMSLAGLGFGAVRRGSRSRP